MNIDTFTAAVTHTVLHFQRDGGEFVNTVTGVHGFSGWASLDCGHRTYWRPLGESFSRPRRGDSLMCAPCIEGQLETLKADAGS